MTLKIPYPPTKAGRSQWAKEYGLNAYWAGKHWAKRKADAEYWHSMVRGYLRQQCHKQRMFEKPVTIEFYWNDNLDLDNHAAMAKMIVDSFKGVILQDDSRRWIHGIYYGWHDENYIEVRIGD